MKNLAKYKLGLFLAAFLLLQGVIGNSPQEQTLQDASLYSKRNLLTYTANNSTHIIIEGQTIALTNGDDGATNRTLLDSSSSTVNIIIKNMIITCSPTVNTGRSTFAALFKISNAISVTSSNNQFSGCYNGVLGGIFYLSNTVFTDTTSTFTNISSVQGGAIALIGSKATFTGTIMNYCYGEGAFVYSQGFVNVIYAGVQASFLYGSPNGGLQSHSDTRLVTAFATSVAPSTQYMSNITINTASTISNVMAVKYGGVLYIDDELTQVTISGGVTIQNVRYNSLDSTADTNIGGGFIYAKRLLKFDMRDSTVTNTYSKGSSASVAFPYNYCTDCSAAQTANLNALGEFFQMPLLQFTQVQVYLQNCVFLGTTIDPINTALQLPFGALFNIQAFNKQVVSISNTFQRIFTSQTGGVFRLDQSSVGTCSFSDSNSMYQNSYAKVGLAFSGSDCNLSFQNLTLQQSRAGSSLFFNYGVVLKPSSTVAISQINIKDSIISNCQLLNFGSGLKTAVTVSQLTTSNITCDQLVTSVSLSGIPSFTLQDSILSTTTVAAAGSVQPLIKLASIPTATFKNVTIRGFSSRNTSSFIQVDGSTTVNLQSNTLDCNGLVSLGILYKLTTVTTVNSDQNTVQNCNLRTMTTNVYELQSVTTFKETGAKVQNSLGLGWVYRVLASTTRTTLTLDGTNLTTVNMTGGIIAISENPIDLLFKSASISNITFMESLLFMSDSITTSEKSSIVLRQSTFRNCIGQFSGVFFMSSYSLSAVTVQQTTFQMIQTSTGGIFYFPSIFKGTLWITGSLFESFGTYYLGKVSHCTDPDSNFVIDTTTFDCYTTIESTLTTLASTYMNQWKSSTQAQYGLFTLAYMKLIKVDGVTARNCQNEDYGAFLNATHTEVQVSNSQFSNFYSKNQGTLYIVGSNLTISNSSFTGIQSGQSGACITTKANGYTNILNVTFSTISSILGGAIVLDQNADEILETRDQVLFIKDCTFTGVSALKGGSIFSQYPYTYLTLVNNYVQDSSSSSLGGFINILNGQTLNLTNITIGKSLSSAPGAFLYSANPDLTITIDQIKHFCDLSQVSSQAYIYLLNPKSVSITNTNVTNCYLTNTKTYFYLYESNIIEQNNYYFNLTGEAGSVFTIAKSNMTIKNSQFLQNTGSVGGVITVSDNSLVNIIDSNFISNKAQQTAGVILVQSNSSIVVDNCTFDKNYAPSYSVMQILDASDTQFTIIKNSKIQNNIADKATMSLIKCNVRIENSLFYNNMASDYSKNLLVGYGDIVIVNSIFTFPSKTENVPKNADGTLMSDISMGAFIFVISDVNLGIYNSTFQYGSAERGGAIYIQNQCVLTIVDSKFLDNYSQTYGGAIEAMDFDHVDLKNTLFRDNQAALNGDDFYLSNSNGLNYLDGLEVVNTIGKTSFYVELAEIVFINSSFTGISSQTTQLTYGSAVQCVNCNNFQFNSSRVSNCYARYGGAIYIEEADNQNTDITNEYRYIISDSTFDSNWSPYGGVLYALSTTSFLITNSTFLNNSAVEFLAASKSQGRGSGGAIYFTCSSSRLETCTMTVGANNNFTANSAKYRGGAIYWDQIEPIFDFENLYFKDNSAVFYGSNIACFSQRLVKIQQDTYDRQIAITAQEGRRRLETLNYTDYIEFDANFSLSSQVSGSPLTTTLIGVIDKYGQIVGSDSESKLRVLVDPFFNDDVDNVYPPVIEGTNIFFVKNGVTQIKDIILSANPGHNYKIVVQTDGIDLTKKNNVEYMEAMNVTALDLEIKVNLRLCLPGERFTQNGKCVKCDGPDSYSLDKQTEPGTCTECPTYKAVCEGGAQIWPRPGYWRYSNISSEIVQCQYSAACLGKVDSELVPLGSCAEGYRGILCSDCELEYSRSGANKCGACPSKTVNIVRIAFIMLGVICLIVFLIYSTLKGAMNKKSITNIFMKILLNHFQLIMVTATFDFSWTDKIKSFFTGSKEIATAPAQIFSFDCLLSQRIKINETDYYIGNEEFVYDSGYNKDTRIFYQKMIMIGLLPFILIILCAAAWNLVKVFRKVWLKFKGKNGQAQTLNPAAKYEKNSQASLPTARGKNKHGKDVEASDDNELNESQRRLFQKDAEKVRDDSSNHSGSNSGSKSGSNSNTGSQRIVSNPDSGDQSQATNLNGTFVNGAYVVTGKIIASIVIVLFLIHPTIIQYMFSNFKCFDIHGQSRLLSDLEIVCYDPDHTQYSFIVAIPSLILWGVGIPMFALIVLMIYRAKLDTKKIREQYGFLYKGYKVKYFYWEVVIMYRKILIICIAVFISRFGLIVQAFIVLVVLILFLLVNSMKKPYVTIVLNDLESLSLVVSIITIYCGIFFILKQPQDWIDANPDYSAASLSMSEDMETGLFAVIVIANIGFFALWTTRMYNEIKSRFVRSLPKVYTIMCLCRNEEKLTQTMMDITMKEEHDHHHEQFMQIVEDLNAMVVGKDRLKLNEEVMKALREYFDIEVLKEIIGQNSTAKDLSMSQSVLLKKSTKQEGKGKNKGDKERAAARKNKFDIQFSDEDDYSGINKQKTNAFSAQGSTTKGRRDKLAKSTSKLRDGEDYDTEEQTMRKGATLRGKKQSTNIKNQDDIHLMEQDMGEDRGFAEIKEKKRDRATKKEMPKKNRDASGSKKRVRDKDREGTVTKGAKEKKSTRRHKDKTPDGDFDNTQRDNSSMQDLNFRPRKTGEKKKKDKKVLSELLNEEQMQPETPNEDVMAATMKNAKSKKKKKIHQADEDPEAIPQSSDKLKSFHSSDQVEQFEPPEHQEEKLVSSEKSTGQGKGSGSSNQSGENQVKMKQTTPSNENNNSLGDISNQQVLEE